MSAAVTFGIALVLLIAFIVFRFWEEKRAVRFLAPTRSGADEVVLDMYQAAVRGNVPEKYRIMVLKFLHLLAHETVAGAVEALRAAERPLTRLSYRLRRSVPAANGKEPSPFLKTLAPDKKPEGEDMTNTI